MPGHLILFRGTQATAQRQEKGGQVIHQYLVVNPRCVRRFILNTRHPSIHEEVGMLLDEVSDPFVAFAANRPGMDHNQLPSHHVAGNGLGGAEKQAPIMVKHFRDESMGRMGW